MGEKCILQGNGKSMTAAFGEILFDVYPGQELLGGAPFNFLFHIHALTGTGSIISRIGNDARGASVQKFLERHSIDRQYLQIDRQRPTGTAVVQLHDGGIPSFTITENSAYDFIEATPETRTAVERCAMLYFGTLAQRHETSRAALYDLCGRAGRCYYDVNLRQRYYTAEILHRSLTFADIVKLNVDELEAVQTLLFSSSSPLESAAHRLMEKYSLTHLAVTAGEEGSWIFTPAEKHYCRTTANRVLDTVGAGDAFAAMMCIGIMRHWSLDRIHETASAFSADLCGVNGALPAADTFYDPYRERLSP